MNDQKKLLLAIQMLILLLWVILMLFQKKIGGKEQIKIIKESGILQHNSDEFWMQDTDQKVNWSFVAFPYDFIPKDFKLPRFDLNLLKDKNSAEQKIITSEYFKDSCRALGGQLDQVFSYGFKDIRTSIWPTPIFFDCVILKHIEEGPAFTSDHQPIVVECKF